MIGNFWSKVGAKYFEIQLLHHIFNIILSVAFCIPPSLRVIFLKDFIPCRIDKSDKSIPSKFNYFMLCAKMLVGGRRIYEGGGWCVHFFYFWLCSSRFAKYFLPVLSNFFKESFVKIFHMNGRWFQWHPKEGVYDPHNSWGVFFRHVDHGK